MNERAKITASHISRQAIVYLRQSSAAQVENNRESTERQYALATKARELGWPEDRIVVTPKSAFAAHGVSIRGAYGREPSPASRRSPSIDEDLGLSGSGSVARSGFARLTAEVA